VTTPVKSDHTWSEKMLTRRVAPESQPEALERERDDVKVVIEVNAP
jgi:hypothetical protein